MVDPRGRRLVKTNKGAGLPVNRTRLDVHSEEDRPLVKPTSATNPRLWGYQPPILVYGDGEQKLGRGITKTTRDQLFNHVPF